MVGDEIGDQQPRHDTDGAGAGRTNGQAHGQRPSGALGTRSHIPTIRATEPLRLNSKESSAYGQRAQTTALTAVLRARPAARGGCRLAKFRHPPGAGPTA